MHIGFDTNDMPKFWKIRKIAIIERNLSAMKFVVEPMETITFDHHFHNIIPIGQTVSCAGSHNVMFGNWSKMKQLLTSNNRMGAMRKVSRFIE